MQALTDRKVNLVVRTGQRNAVHPDLPEILAEMVLPVHPDPEARPEPTDKLEKENPDERAAPDPPEDLVRYRFQLVIIWIAYVTKNALCG